MNDANGCAVLVDLKTAHCESVSCNVHLDTQRAFVGAAEGVDLPVQLLRMNICSDGFGQPAVGEFLGCLA